MLLLADLRDERWFGRGWSHQLRGKEDFPESWRDHSWKPEKALGPEHCLAKIFILIGCGVLHMQLWRHNKGTYDILKIHTPHEEYLLCAKYQFFPWYSFRYTEVQSFSVFPTWLPHYMTYDIIIITKIFYMSIRSYGENFISIWQAVASKNTKVLRGQTNKKKTSCRGRYLQNP